MFNNKREFILSKIQLSLRGQRTEKGEFDWISAVLDAAIISGITLCTGLGSLASAAEAGNVRLVEGVWNSAFLDEVEAFPEGNHDDQVDVAAYAYNILCSTARLPKVKHA
jgi:hypothetical protein